jgi:hypothetical protein
MGDETMRWVRFSVFLVLFLSVIACCGYSAIKDCKKQEQLLEEEVFDDTIV